jgi:hypothetical protein
MWRLVHPLGNRRYFVVRASNNCAPLPSVYTLFPHLLSASSSTVPTMPSYTLNVKLDDDTWKLLKAGQYSLYIGNPSQTSSVPIIPNIADLTHDTTQKVAIPRQ